jgi:hypothetical protein
MGKIHYFKQKQKEGGELRKLNLQLQKKKALERRFSSF